jgi:hypothetical protein
MTELEDEQRLRLAALADVLIPGGAGLPSASAADVAGRWIDRTLAADPGLAVSVLAVVTGDVEDPHMHMKSVQHEDPVLFERFAFAVAGAYFMNPEVRRRFGYPGIAPLRLPAAPGEAEYYLEDDILAPVIERGPTHRLGDLTGS